MSVRTLGVRRPIPSRCEPLEGRQLFNAVTSFTLINSQTDQPVATINNGDTINLANYPTGKLNVRVNTDNAGVQSVVLALDNKPKFNVENDAPYALFGNQGNNYKDGTFALGSHTLKATPFSRDGGAGTAGTAKQVTFNVVRQTTPTPTPTVPAITRFALMDADTDTEIKTLTNGETINLATLRTRKLNVLAIPNPGGTIKSVKFGLDANANFNIEGTAPYALFGDTAGNLSAGTFTVGSHTLKAQAFAGNNATGAAGAAGQIQFVIKDEDPTPPPPVAPQVTQFLLIDSISGQLIREVKDGDVIDVDKDGEEIRGLVTIEVKTSGTAGSVKSELSDIVEFPDFVDDAAPYTVQSIPPLFGFGGVYDLTATAYSGAGASGVAGPSKTISFAFVRDTGNVFPFETGFAGEFLFRDEPKQFTVAQDDVNVFTVQNLSNQPRILRFGSSANTIMTLNQHATTADPLTFAGATVLPLVPGPRLNQYLEYFDANAPESGDRVANSGKNFTLLGGDLKDLPDDTGPEIQNFAIASAPEPDPGSPLFFPGNEIKTLQPGERVQLAVIGLLAGTSNVFEFVDRKFTVDVALPTAGTLTVLYDIPDDERTTGANDVVFATDDLTTPELDVGFAIPLSYEDKPEPGGIKQFSAENRFAFANIGPTPLTLGDPIEMSINFFLLEPSSGVRFLSLDKSRTIDVNEYRDAGGYQILDSKNVAIRSEIIGRVPSDPDGPKPNTQLPVYRINLLRADLSQPLVLSAAGASDGSDRLDFTLAQGDTPAQGTGKGKPAPASKPVAPKGRR